MWRRRDTAHARRHETECGRRRYPYRRGRQAPSPPEPESSNVSGPGQNRDASRRASSGITPSRLGDLSGIGGNQRQRPLGIAAFDGEHTRDHIRPERIGGQPVQRIRRHRNHAAVADRTNRFVQRTVAETRPSTTIRCTVHHQYQHSGFTTTDTKNTRKDDPVFSWCPLCPLW